MPYAETGQVSLYYEEAGQGAVPVVLLPELGGTSESWRRVIPLLATSRRVIAPDPRGTGRSEKRPGGFEIDDVADDVAGLLNALGVDRADVLGSALGSLAGAVLARRHPCLVRRLVLCAVADDQSGRTAAYLSERAARVRREGMRAVADASLANAFPEAFAAERAAYRPIYIGNDPAAYAEMSLALMRLRMGTAAWGAIQAPVLVAPGRHDFIWPPPLGQRVAEQIPGARFTVLEDAGHFPHMQTPEAVVEIAEAFLAG